MVILHSISRNEGTSLIGRHCSFSHLHVYTWHCLDIVDSSHCHCYLDQDLGRRNEGGNNMLTVKSYGRASTAIDSALGVGMNLGSVGQSV